MKQIKIGAGFGLWRLGMPSAETIARVAERAEDWGLDSFWLSDHLLAPSPELDVVATLSLLASRTTRMKLGPSVLLLYKKRLDGYARPASRQVSGAAS